MIKESDIRSDKTLNEYQRLVDKDSKKLLKRKNTSRTLIIKS